MFDWLKRIIFSYTPIPNHECVRCGTQLTEWNQNQTWIKFATVGQFFVLFFCLECQTIVYEAIKQACKTDH